MARDIAQRKRFWRFSWIALVVALLIGLSILGLGRSEADKIVDDPDFIDRVGDSPGLADALEGRLNAALDASPKVQVTFERIVGAAPQNPEFVNDLRTELGFPDEVTLQRLSLGAEALSELAKDYVGLEIVRTAAG